MPDYSGLEIELGIVALARVESNPVGINPTQLATLVALSSCLYPTPEIAEAESKALDKESALDSGSAVTCLPVTSTFVENVSNVVRDTPVLLSMVVPDSVMSLQPCSSSTSLFKPSLTTAVPIVLDTNSSITLGSPKGHYANLGQGIRAKDQGHMTDPHPTLILPSIVPDTNPSIPLGSPMGQYAHLGQGIRAKDQGHMNDPQPTLSTYSYPLIPDYNGLEIELGIVALGLSLTMLTLT